MASNASRTVTLRFHQSRSQNIGEVTKVVGLVKVRQLISLIDVLDLEANPRASKVGPVTREIQNSLSETPLLFPFKTKGILLGASSFIKYDQRERYQLTFENPKIEGILDGGHNMLAIGMEVLESAMGHAGEDIPKGIKTWADFKTRWMSNRDYVQAFMEGAMGFNPHEGNVLDVFVPVELVLPSSDDPLVVQDFKTYLLDICAARNNNVQLSLSTKANKRGDFDSIKAIIKSKDPNLFDRIEWKTNAGGDINVEDIITLAWIPLSLLDGFSDSTGKPITPPSPVTLYSGKAGTLKKYELLLDSPDVTIQGGGDYRRELRNTEVQSALSIAADIPELYDYIMEHFPKLYNAAGGHYGAISSVAAINSKYSDKRTKFGRSKIETLSPEGFITPYVYGLKALLEVKRGDDGNRIVSWRDGSVEKVKDWLDQNLGKVVERCWKDINPWNYDPVKYGKASQSYEHVYDSYRMTLAGL